MSGVVRWFKSGGAVLTNISPLVGEDGAEDRDDHEEVEEDFESESPKQEPGTLD